MQAIISDIIVNQTLQTGNLQISQLTQNNSSPQQSFIDMLNSVRKQETDLPEKETELKTSYEDKKTVEVSDTEKDQKSETAERTENKNSEVKNSESKATEEEGTEKSNLHKDKDTAPKLLNKGNPETNGKKVESKDADNKDQNLSLTKNLKKIDEKKLNVNVEEEIAETTELSENAAIQTASSMNAVKSELNVETKVSDNNVLNEIDTETLSLSENKNDILQNKLTADEKVYALDKNSKIIVRDQRTEQPETKPSEKNNSKAQLQVHYDNQNNATITMELAEQTASENILSLDNQTAAAEGSNFQAMLNNQIQANAPEFVKAGSLILQDNNKGTINLVLHPDDLGNVKIHLSMDGKTVSAHITVNTKEALEVFKDNAQTLREAFAKNGYETSNFDVSYNGSSNNQNQEFEGRYDGIEYMARKVYNESLGGGNDGYIPDSYEFAQNSEYSINIVA